jgi:hypothetical protein
MTSAEGELPGCQAGTVAVGKVGTPWICPMPVSAFWLLATPTLREAFTLATVLLAIVVTTPIHEQSAMIVTSPSTPLTIARNWRSVSHRS